MNVTYEDPQESTHWSNDMRMAAGRAELAGRIQRALPRDGSIEPMKGLHLHRVSSVTDPIHGVTVPSLCVIAQGAKIIHLGGERYRYDPLHYLLTTYELPVASQLVEASPDEPYLSLRLVLDPALVASVIIEAGMPPTQGTATRIRAVDVSPLDVNLLDATVRLVRILDEPPREARVLQPLVTREIVFRLFTGDQGARLSQLAVLGGHADRVAQAIDKLRNEFDKPLRIESLAREIGMSPSGFHEHFKAVTAMSPLQFQKQLRLREARRLMLGEDMDASTAAYRVGYDDLSHFSREYKRHFGQPPMRDVRHLRETAAISQ